MARIIFERCPVVGQLRDKYSIESDIGESFEVSFSPRLFMLSLALIDTDVMSIKS